MADEKFRLFEGVSRLGVAVSGGADSMSLLHALLNINSLDCAFSSIVPIYVSQYRNASKQQQLSDYISEKYNLDLIVVGADNVEDANRLIEMGKAPCRACAPKRARALSDVATRLNLDAIALGHHLDDAIATMTMNLFHRGRPTPLRPAVRRRGTNEEVPTLRPMILASKATILQTSPVPAAGLFSCGVCDQAAGERQLHTEFAQQVMRQHPITELKLREFMIDRFGRA